MSGATPKLWLTDGIGMGQMMKIGELLEELQDLPEEMHDWEVLAGATIETSRQINNIRAVLDTFIDGEKYVPVICLIRDEM